MTLDGHETDELTDLFNTNASIVRDLAKAAADASPNANVLVISNPVCIHLLLLAMQLH